MVLASPRVSLVAMVYLGRNVLLSECHRDNKEEEIKGIQSGYGEEHMLNYDLDATTSMLGVV